MPYMNLVVLVGNLTRDPQLRSFPNGGTVCDFGLAVSRTFRTSQGEQREEVVFVDVECYSQLADNCRRFIAKGSPVCIQGRLRLDQWNDRATGEQRRRLKVVAETVEFLARRPDENGGQGGEYANQNYDNAGQGYGNYGGGYGNNGPQGGYGAPRQNGGNQGYGNNGNRGYGNNSGPRQQGGYAAPPRQNGYAPAPPAYNGTAESMPPMPAMPPTPSVGPAREAEDDLIYETIPPKTSAPASAAGKDASPSSSSAAAPSAGTPPPAAAGADSPVIEDTPF